MTRLKALAWAGLLPGLAICFFSAMAAGFGPPQAKVDAQQANRPSHVDLDQYAASTAAYKDYMLACGGCHRFDGEGIGRNAVPSFRNSVGMFTQLPEGRAYMIRVPGASQSPLGNAELAQVLNWMVANFSPEQVAADFRPFTANEVGAVRPYRFDDVASARRELEGQLAEKNLHPAPYLYGVN